MRVLTLTSLFPNSVAPRHGIFVYERLRHLVERGSFDVRVVAPVPWFPIASQSFGRYGDYARVPAYERFSSLDVHHPRFVALPKIGNSIAPLTYARSVKRCLAHLGWTGFDLIDAHYGFPDGVAAALVAKALSIPMVLTVRGTDINVLPHECAAGWWLRRMLPHCDAIVSVSDALRARLVALYPSLASRTVVIPNGVDQLRFHPLPNRDEIRRQLEVSGDVVLSVGNLVPTKGHDIVIGALAGLQSTSLLVVGEGPEMSRLRGLVNKLGLAERVRFIPNVSQEELVRFYNAADVLALASVNEGLPNVVLESLACGTPVVATDVGGLREVVRDRLAGRLVGSRTVESFATALRVMFRSPRQDRAGVRGQVASFDWTRTSQAVYELFKTVIAARDSACRQRDSTS